MRCSVKAALRLPDEDFTTALWCALAIEKARPFIIERERKKLSSAKQ